MSTQLDSKPAPAVIKEMPAPGKKQKISKKRTRSEKSRVDKILPTPRITFEKQLDILRAYAVSSSDGTKAAPLKEVAAIIDMADSTVSLANAFFCSVGFIQRTDSGFTSAPEVVAFLRAYQWNRETASYKLAPIIQGAWFAEALLPKLEFGDKTEDEAITLLAEAAGGAGPDRRRELSILIDYMQAAGLVRREGGQVKKSSNNGGQVPTQPQQPETARDSGTIEAPAFKARVNTAFAKEAEGAVNFNVSVRVNMQEFGGWQADRITAFFSGIAQVLNAKAGIEEGEGAEK